MTRSLEDYRALITAWQRSKPRFVATVSATLEPFVEAQAGLAAIPPAFDIDAAVGAQLTILGEILGQDRNVTHPVKGQWFSLDDSARGLDMGRWRGAYDVTVASYTLDDSRYRRLLKARILAAQTDGTLPFMQSVLDAYFAGTGVGAFIEDRTAFAQPEVQFSLDRPGYGFDQSLWARLLFGFDLPDRGFDDSRWIRPLEDDNDRRPLPMELSIVVIGPRPDATDLAILAGGLLPIRPQGVTLDVRVASVADGPIFGLDIDNPRIGGFDRGSYGVPPLALLT